MSSRSRSRSAFSSNLSGGISDSADAFNLDDATGLVAPVYLVIEPDDLSLREFVKVGSVVGNALSSVERGLAGSANGAQAHLSGREVRAVMVHQHLDDIFGDIEAIEADVTTAQSDIGTLQTDVGALEAADTAHIGGTDTADHPEATGSVRGFMSAADKTKLDGLAATLAALYPVGSLYFNASVATNPATLLGFGTWTAFGAGRVLVGLNAADPDFDTLEETGGSKVQATHIHGIPHTHQVDPPSTVSAVEPQAPVSAVLFTSPSQGSAVNAADDDHTHATNIAPFTSGAASAADSGAGGNDSIVQPYIVVHIWKRTA